MCVRIRRSPSSSAAWMVAVEHVCMQKRQQQHAMQQQLRRRRQMSARVYLSLIRVKKRPRLPRVTSGGGVNNGNCNNNYSRLGRVLTSAPTPLPAARQPPQTILCPMCGAHKGGISSWANQSCECAVSLRVIKSCVRICYCGEGAYPQ